MKLTLSSKIENDYLIVEASGSIADIEEYKLIAKRYCTEIMKYDIKKIIIDESKMKYPNSLVLQSDIVKYYSVGLPNELRFWKLACVVDRNMIDIAKFWEFKATESEYNHKAFESIEEAKAWISEHSV